VTPTERAVANLRILRAAWSRELASILGDDLDAVRHCNQLPLRWLPPGPPTGLAFRMTCEPR